MEFYGIPWNSIIWEFIEKCVQLPPKEQSRAFFKLVDTRRRQKEDENYRNQLENTQVLQNHGDEQHHMENGNSCNEAFDLQDEVVHISRISRVR